MFWETFQVSGSDGTPVFDVTKLRFFYLQGAFFSPPVGWANPQCSIYLIEYTPLFEVVQYSCTPLD